jgi:hypothetical protein
MLPAKLSTTRTPQVCASPVHSSNAVTSVFLRRLLAAAAPDDPAEAAAEIADLGRLGILHDAQTTAASSTPNPSGPRKGYQDSCLDEARGDAVEVATRASVGAGDDQIVILAEPACRSDNQRRTCFEVPVKPIP